MNLITGATGHVGNVLTRELLARQEKVRALVLPGEDCSAIEGLPIEKIEGNVLVPSSLDKAMKQVETVYHLAGIISIMPGANEVMRRVNVIGTINVARAARKSHVRRMVYTSSIHALRRLPHGTCIDEKAGFDPHNPAGEYDRTKALASLALLKEAQKGLDTVLICPTGVLGPHDYRVSEVGHLIRSWMKRRPHVFVDGKFDWVDVRDLAQGLVLAAEKGKASEVYILGGKQVHLHKILSLVSESRGAYTSSFCIPMNLALFFSPFTEFVAKVSKSKPQFTSYSLETIRSNSKISSEKARRELGYTTRPFEETVNDTVKWWQTYKEARY
jgi:dihydroflavonol-4-reductase